MKFRRGFYKVAMKRLRRLDIRWFIRQAIRSRNIKRSFFDPRGRAFSGPLIGHIFLTNRCNLRCEMCDIPDLKTAYEMTTADCIDVLDQLASLGALAVSFTGGEPLLRKDLFELMKYARRRGLDTVIVTNGLLLEKNMIDLLAAGPSIINISLDGSKPETHDAQRRSAGAFAITTRAIGKLADKIKASGAKTDVVISTVISKNNIDDLDAILKYVKSLNGPRVILCPVHDFSRDGGGSLVTEVKCDYDLSGFLKAHAARGVIDNSDQYISYLSRVIAGEEPPSGCASGCTTVFFDWEMNVYPCKARLEQRQPIGTLRMPAKRLKEIWYSPEYDRFRTKARSCRRCFLTVNREFDFLFNEVKSG
jgi:MoaA/NifB/PqqE/SkfB family radical SAM enzyme